MEIGGVGVERRLPLRVTFTGYFVVTRRVHDLLTRNINAPAANGLRPFGGDNNIFQIESAGITKWGDLMAQARYIGRKLTFFAVYTYGTAHSISDGPFSFPADSYDLGPVVGNLSSPFFGQPTTIAGGFGYGSSFNPSYKRRIEGQLRLSF